MRVRSALIGVVAFAALAGCSSSTSTEVGPLTVSLKPTATPSDSVAWKTVSYDGIKFQVPSRWPVLDGAHARYECGSTFEGQANRVFLGPTYFRTPECPAMLGKPAAVDGAWIQKSGPPTLPTDRHRLTSGEMIRMRDLLNASGVVAWVHGVSIQIGIGPDPTIERRILNSITYSPGTANTPVLGRCPQPSAARSQWVSPTSVDRRLPVMPNPTRLAIDLVSLDGTGSILPAPTAVRPHVAASTVWMRFFADFGTSAFPGPLTWSIKFGIDPSQGGARVWVIGARAVETAYGPCGMTMQAEYNASTGLYLTLTEVG